MTSTSFAPITTEEDQIDQVTQAPAVAAPLDESVITRAAGATSPPQFVQSFETTEETLPFELSISEIDGQVVIKPHEVERAEPKTEEIKEEFVELEVKAELKWAKS